MATPLDRLLVTALEEIGVSDIEEVDITWLRNHLETYIHRCVQQLQDGNAEVVYDEAHWAHQDYIKEVVASITPSTLTPTQRACVEQICWYELHYFVKNNNLDIGPARATVMQLRIDALEDYLEKEGSNSEDDDPASNSPVIVPSQKRTPTPPPPKRQKREETSPNNTALVDNSSNTEVEMDEIQLGLSRIFLQAVHAPNPSSRQILEPNPRLQQIEYAAIRVPYVQSQASAAQMDYCRTLQHTKLSHMSRYVAEHLATSMVLPFNSVFMSVKSDIINNNLRLPESADGFRIHTLMTSDNGSALDPAAKVINMGKMKSSSRDVAKIVNFNYASIKDLEEEIQRHAEASLRESRQSCTESQIKAARSSALKPFQKLVAEHLDSRKFEEYTASQNYNYNKRANCKYETMARWKTKGYMHLVAYADKSLNKLLKDPSDTAGRGRQHIEAWEDVIGPLLEDICTFPWRGTDADQRTAEAALVTKITGQAVYPHEVNVNQTVWACPAMAHQHAKQLPSLSHVGGNRTASVSTTKESRISGFLGNLDTHFASLVTLVKRKDGEILLVCPVNLPEGSFLGTVTGELHTGTKAQAGWVQGPNNVYLEPGFSRMAFLFTEPEHVSGNVQLTWDLVEDETLRSLMGPSWRFHAWTKCSVPAFTKLTVDIINPSKAS